MPNERYIWERVSQIVKANPEITASLSAQLNLAVTQGSAGGALYLMVAHPFTQQLLEDRLRDPILAAFKEIPEAAEITDFVILVNENMESEITVDNSPAETPAVADTAPANAPATITKASQNPWETNDPQLNKNVSKEVAASQNSAQDQSFSVISNVDPKTMLNPQYVFENFVIGATNRLAHAASIAVAENPGKSYQPLLIYGDSGLGKTHLLHAIGNYARQMHNNIRVRYVSSEEFTNDFINAIRAQKGHDFHDRWRQVDILLIDDIQFLEKKTGTIEAFFNTFNTLQQQNKQIVMTSDVPAKKLQNIEERLVSRFKSGLSTDIQAPDIETRTAILRVKAEREELNVDNSILEFIASKCTANVRELEGALLRLVALSNLEKKEITLDLVSTALKDILPTDEDEEINPNAIVQEAANYFKITSTDIFSKARSQNIVLPRQVAMYLCRELTNLSLPKIGALFGGRDHTTVLHSTQKIGNLLNKDRTLYNQVSELTAQIRRNSKN